MLLDECCYVCDDGWRSARETSVRSLVDGASPAALIPGEDLDIGSSEDVEELVVTVDVLIKAMDKDELSFDGAGGLRGVSDTMLKNIESGQTYGPCFCVKLDSIVSPLALCFRTRSHLKASQAVRPRSGLSNNSRLL